MNYLALLHSDLRHYFFRNWLVTPNILNCYWVYLPLLAGFTKHVEDAANVRQSMVEYAIMHGYLKMLIWLKQQWKNVTFSRDEVELAIKHERLDILKWLSTKTMLLDTDMLFVTEKGNLPMLQYLVQQECPIHYDVLLEATRKGHLHILQWIHAEQCVKNVALKTLSFTSFTDKSNLLELRFTPKLGTIAVQHDKVDIVSWLIKIGCYSKGAAISESIDANTFAILKQFCSHEKDKNFIRNLARMRAQVDLVTQIDSL